MPTSQDILPQDKLHRKITAELNRAKEALANIDPNLFTNQGLHALQGLDTSVSLESQNHLLRHCQAIESEYNINLIKCRFLSLVLV